MKRFVLVSWVAFATRVPVVSKTCAVKCFCAVPGFKTRLKIGNWIVKQRQQDSTRCCLPSILLDVMGCFGNEGSKESQAKKRDIAIGKQLKKDKQVYRATHRLLLLGKYLSSCRVVFLSLLVSHIEAQCLYDLLI